MPGRRRSCATSPSDRPMKGEMEQEDAKTRRFEDCSKAVIGACIEVHRHLGPGLLESAYEHCVAHQLTYLRLTLLVNFRDPVLKIGLRRLTLSPSFPSSRLPVSLSNSAR